MRKESICIKIYTEPQLEVVKTYIEESKEAGKPYYGSTPCYLEFSSLSKCWELQESPTENKAVYKFSFLELNRIQIIPPKLSYEKLKEGFDALYDAHQVKTKEYEELKSQLLEAKHMPGIYAAEAPSHYDNSKGSLYKVATERGWNPYLFDIVKRLERGGKKDPIEQEIDKTIYVLKLWKEEQKG